MTPICYVCEAWTWAGYLVGGVACAFAAAVLLAGAAWARDRLRAFRGVR